MRRSIDLQMKTPYVCKQVLMKLLTQRPKEIHHQFTYQNFANGPQIILIHVLDLLD